MNSGHCTKQTCKFGLLFVLNRAVQWLAELWNTTVPLKSKLTVTRILILYTREVLYNDLVT